MPKIETIKDKYRTEGLWSAVKEVPVQSWNLVKENPYKTTATFTAIAVVTSLTAAYFLSPTYAAYVGVAGAKAAALVSPAITAVSAFLVAHPLVASLIVVAAVAALITAPVLAWKNSNKAGQIDEVKELLNTENDAIKLNVKNPKTPLEKIAVVLHWEQKAQGV